GQHLGSRRRQLRDFDSARVKCTVELAVEVPRDEQVDPDADDDDREYDRRRGRGDRTPPKREAAHPSLKPVPRTVSINGGSPSFTRRYDTYRSTTFRLAAAGLSPNRPHADPRPATPRPLSHS